jgi:serine/threonine protein phosphatase PrpC
MVPQSTISQTLGEGTADEVAWRLIELANKAGGHDNITIILIDILS